jgi:hypothetical protein
LQPSGGGEGSRAKADELSFLPLQVDALHAKLEFHDFRAGDVINPRPASPCGPAPLNHPAARSAIGSSTAAEPSPM